MCVSVGVNPPLSPRNRTAPLTSAAGVGAHTPPQPLFPLCSSCSHQGTAFCYLNRLHEEQGNFQVLNRKAIFKAAQNLLQVGMRRHGIKSVGGMVLFWKQGNPNFINISEESKSFCTWGFPRWDGEMHFSIWKIPGYRAKLKNSGKTECFQPENYLLMK